MKDYTPAHRKCAIGASCPSIHQLEDGRWLVVGESAHDACGHGDDLLDRAYGALIDKDAIGENEASVILPSDLLDEIKAEAIREYLAQQREVRDEPRCVHPVSEQVEQYLVRRRDELAEAQEQATAEGASMVYTGGVMALAAALDFVRDLKASSPTSGDRTVSAPRKTSVEPNLTPGGSE